MTAFLSETKESEQKRTATTPPPVSLGAKGDAERVLLVLKTCDSSGSNKYTAEQIRLAVAHASLTKTKDDIKRSMYAISFATLILVLAFIGALIIILPYSQNSLVDSHDVLVNKQDGRPVRVQQHVDHIPIQGLSITPLTNFENMDTLILKWGNTGSGPEITYFYKIESAFSEASTSTTTLRLSSGHRLVITPDEATLYDENSKQLNVMIFNPHDDEDVKNSEIVDTKKETKDVEDSDNDENSADPAERRLGKKKNGGGLFGPPPNPEGLPTSFFDAHCRYGCGGMSVTFPYYYRPFFGYGYPLVGTDAMFPQGYGGYAAAPLMASQAGAAGVSSTAVPVLAGGAMTAPGIGAAAIAGGASPVALPPAAFGGAFPPF